MLKLVWFLVPSLITALILSPAGTRLFNQWVPEGSELEILRQYHADYVAAVMIGLAAGAMIARYWPRLLGWQKDAEKYETMFREDMAGLLKTLKRLKWVFETGAPFDLPTIEIVVGVIEAREVSLQHRGFETPRLSYEKDPVGYLQRNSDYYAQIAPLVLAGHIREAKREAQKFVRALPPELRNQPPKSN